MRQAFLSHFDSGRAAMIVVAAQCVQVLVQAVRQVSEKA